MASLYPEAYATWVLSRPLSRRARRAVERMIDKGSITTADLNEMGYEHPPRAIGDIKDAGIRIKKTMITIDGRRMARYELDTGSSIAGELTGRRGLSKAFRDSVSASTDNRCAICGGRFTSRELQADHRVPFRVAGEDSDTTELDDYMPLCPSCNRAKSWSCEHCPNWGARIHTVCDECMWASPEVYSHIATIPERRMTVAWSGEVEVEAYDRLAALAEADGEAVAQRAKRILAQIHNGGPATDVLHS